MSAIGVVSRNKPLVGAVKPVYPAKPAKSVPILPQKRDTVTITASARAKNKEPTLTNGESVVQTALQHSDLATAGIYLGITAAKVAASYAAMALAVSKVDLRA